MDLRYLGGGREFYKTEDEATAARRRKVDQVKAHGASALALSNGERLDFVRARDELAEFGVSIQQAVEFFKAHHAKRECVSFEAAIDQIEMVKHATNKDGEYVRKLRANLASLMAACDGKALAEVGQQDIERWLFRNGWAPATVRNKRIDVRTFFRFCLGRGWLVTNPAAKLERVELPDAPPGILQVDECRAVVAAAGPVVRPLVVLNLFCGLRPEECVQIVPENVHVERGFVEVTAAVAKSRKRRIVEVSENAKGWLKGAAFVPRSPKWYARQLPGLRREASKLLGRAMPWPKNCLRHSFASYHLAMHGSAEKTALQMGHRSTEMLFRHYRELVTKEEGEKFWGIKP